MSITLSTETIVKQYVALETSAEELEEEINNSEKNKLVEEKQRKILELQNEIHELTEAWDEKAKQIGEQQKLILEKLKERYDGEKTIETNHGTIKYWITKKTIINDPKDVAEILLKNDKGDAIKRFDMKVIRSFIEVGLMNGAATFEENVNVKITQQDKEE